MSSATVTIEQVEAMLRSFEQHPLTQWESRRILDTVDALLRDERARAEWKCKANSTADPPQDCDYPFCGCDPNATKVIDTLQECGWLSPEAVARKQARLSEVLDVLDKHQRGSPSVRTTPENLVDTLDRILTVDAGWNIENERLRARLNEVRELAEKWPFDICAQKTLAILNG